MTREQIIRAWKDEEYRNSLSPAQRARIPANPAGFVDLADEEMQAAVGGATGIFHCVIAPQTSLTAGCFPNEDAGKTGKLGLTGQ